MTTQPAAESIRRRLDEVLDPELRVPITQLGMVGDISVDAGGIADITIKLTTDACPMRSRIVDEVTASAVRSNGITTASVTLDVMTPEERQRVKEQLRGGEGPRVNRFAQPDSLTKVYAVASGKGGVGKSSVTVNLACALAARGLKVGVIDADIHGFSVPDLMGITDKPTRLDELILPPVAHEVKTISIGMFVEAGQAVAWRGPMLHRAVEQFLTDVHFGDLDILLLDLPPGTGDIAISVAQLLPNSQLLVVTTPQAAAAGIAERAGALSKQTNQVVAGVIENMGPMTMPDGTVMDLFGAGGGELVAQRLTDTVGYPVPILGSVPLDPRLRQAGDDGAPVVISDPESAAAAALQDIAQSVADRPRGMSGRSLPLHTA